MNIVDTVSQILDFIRHWRVYASIIPAGLLALSLHSKFPEENWVWFITIPLVIGALVFGFVWQSRSESS